MEIAVSVMLGGLVLLGLSLQRTYNMLPVRELKKRARAGDTFADTLHRVAAYEHNLRAVLWIFIIVCSALFFLAVSRFYTGWLAFGLSALLIWVGYVWLPARQAGRLGLYAARVLAPIFAWAVRHVYPITDRVYSFLRKRYPLTVHTGLYDKLDIIELLSRQKNQPDSDIAQLELDVAINALRFNDQIVRDVLVPRRVVKSVALHETIGPVLMSELHDSGYSRFPVYDEKPDNLVGVLYLHDLVNVKTGGLVSAVVHKRICYIHEEQTLLEALQAILKTKQQLFIVVNSFEEYVGILTMEDVLERLIGRPIVDEFDQYEDMRAVAAKRAESDHEHHVKDMARAKDDLSDTDSSS